MVSAKMDQMMGPLTSFQTKIIQKDFFIWCHLQKRVAGSLDIIEYHFLCLQPCKRHEKIYKLNSINIQSLNSVHI